jgi:hypothetical protein
MRVRVNGGSRRLIDVEGAKLVPRVRVRDARGLFPGITNKSVNYSAGRKMLQTGVQKQNRRRRRRF